MKKVKPGIWGVLLLFAVSIPAFFLCASGDDVVGRAACVSRW